MSENGSHNGKLLAPADVFTGKQRLFIHYYVETLNATQSARMAGYKCSSESALGVIGHGNLRKIKIKDEINRQLETKIMSPQEVMTRLTAQAKAEYTAYMTPQGTLDLAGLMKAGLGHLIKKIKRNNMGGIEVEFYDAQAALVHVGKHFALFTDKIEQENKIILVKGYEDISPDDWDNDNDNETPTLEG